MKILHVSAECYPVAKVGGLADVVGALPKYQNKDGILSEVVMPLYDNKFYHNNSFKSIFDGILKLGEDEVSYEILTLENNELGFNIYFVKIPDLLFKDHVYSHEDTERFLAFQIAVLDWVLTWEEQPTIFHCHDHHTGLVPFMLQESYRYESLNKIPVLFTIHNAQYQGWFGYEKLHMIPEFEFSKAGLLDWGSSINPLAAAIKCSWRVTTVSPSYMEELKLEANGLQDLLAAESDKCVGILNGIDTEVWDTATDSFLFKNFTVKTVASGRKANKKLICEKFGLDIKKPLFAFIGRLVHEKGADLLPYVFDTALEAGDLSIVMLGSGNPEAEYQLDQLKDKYAGTYNTFIGYDEELSHLIYGGADFLLMPSRVEPCGLNQMYSLRYGLIPIVRSIGGLKDTIVDIDNDGFGICHPDTEYHQILEAINRAKKLYEDQDRFKKIRKEIMQIDHSWDASAKEYINLYNSI